MDRIRLLVSEAELSEGVWEEAKPPVIDEEKPSYRYEAERATLHPSLVVENNESASGGKVVGGIANAANDKPGEAYIEFNVNADEDAAGVMILSLALPNGSVASNAFTMTINDVLLPVETDTIKPYESDYENSWFNYVRCSVCEINLKKGKNVVKLVINGGAICNLDYMEINTSAVLDGVSDKAHVCENPCEVCGKCKDSCVAAECSEKCDCSLEKTTYRFEAEKAESNAWADGSDLLWRSGDENCSGGTYVGHISDTAWNNPGEAYISFTFESDIKATAFLFFNLALPEGKISGSAFKIELNGEEIYKTENSEGNVTPVNETYENGWMNFTDCLLSTRLWLKKGSNVLKITVNSGATCNFDYLELKTAATLTHSYTA